MGEYEASRTIRRIHSETNHENHNGMVTPESGTLSVISPRGGT